MNKNQKLNFNEKIFIYLLLGISIFCIFAVIPAMNHDKKIISVIHKINTQGIHSLTASDDYTIAYKNFQEATIAFKTPDYIFLFMKEEAQKEYQKIIPVDIKIKII